MREACPFGRVEREARPLGRFQRVEREARPWAVSRARHALLGVEREARPLGHVERKARHYFFSCARRVLSAVSNVRRALCAVSSVSSARRALGPCRARGMLFLALSARRALWAVSSARRAIISLHARGVSFWAFRARGAPLSRFQRVEREAVFRSGPEFHATN